MSLDDPPQSFLSSPAEKRPPSDDDFRKIDSHSFPASRHVPLNYFARRDSQALSPGGLEQNVPHFQSPAASTVDTLVGGSFRFDKFLQDRWDRAAKAGISSRHTGVAFKVRLVTSYCLSSHLFAIQDLRVVGLGTDAKYQGTILSAFNPLSLIHWIQTMRHPPVKDILSDFEGVVRPGEMLLVLGRPGSGCSSLLKVLANQRQSFHAVDGKLSYDGITPEYMAKHYRGDLGYAPEEDVHFPTLTVRQTLVGIN